MDSSFYQEVGLVKKWEITYIPQWRGWDAVGTMEDDRVLYMFLPDTLIQLIVEKAEKSPTTGV